MSVVEAPYRLRMPTCFGPAPSPRQDATGARWSSPLANISVVGASFLSDEATLSRLLPPGARLHGEPVVTLEFMYIRDLQWLAGRGYNTLGVRFPIEVAEHGVRGPFLALLWENLTDPILTGREELGFSKLYCDLPDATDVGAGLYCAAAWGGHRFFEMTVLGLVDAEQPTPSDDDGILHYYTMPQIGRPGEVVAQGWVLTPPSPGAETSAFRTGTAEFAFLPSTWEQIPTLVHILDALRALPVLELRGAFTFDLRSDTSLHNHRMLG